jgi:hypothetical protein
MDDTTNYKENFTNICKNIDVKNYIKALIRYYHNKNYVPEYVDYDLFLKTQSEILTEYFIDDYLHGKTDFIESKEFIVLLLFPFASDIYVDTIFSNEFANKYEKIIIPDYIKKIIKKLIKEN